MIPTQAAKRPSTKHISLSLSPIDKGCFWQTVAGFCMLISRWPGEDTFNYAAMQGSIVQSLALLMYQGSKQRAKR